ncbi:aldolase/citrate lyase family protein [Thermomicrobiaceae bacterium CFH 74404]|uniref:Aldolase/citrate lyase family protein n=1 Tax=Thermalbibacter longus TaxID=2951981 RepID=A0AA42BBW6_9BACT|nr:aldolase/citrate lyase family protein [Thermalbibacter longus]MCM8748203.1 aldolase/citrate lyase family protein [Thermalbibacter longus]
MRANAAKQKMLQGKPAFGYSLQLGSPLVAEALSSCGVDFILIDTQHGSFSPESTLLTLMALAHGTAVPMARVARNDYTLIGRLLDEGALGIVVPLVNTREEAQAVADACLLPPRGRRSYGWGRARVYGSDYPDRINDELFVAVQLETIQAVENAEAILSVPGIDGCWIGPADLALSLGIDPRRAAEDDRHARAIERVVEACRNTGKIAGFASYSPEDALRRAEQGFLFLTAGSDIGFMLGGATAGVRTLGLEAQAARGYGE